MKRNIKAGVANTSLVSKLNAQYLNGLKDDVFVYNKTLIGDKNVDIDNFVTPGAYGFAYINSNDMPNNFPKTIYSYGTLLVMGRFFPVQILFPHTAGTALTEFYYLIQYRVKYDKAWTEWRTLPSLKYLTENYVTKKELNDALSKIQTASTLELKSECGGGATN